MRSILRSSILAGIALWLLSPALSLADRPNIVLILADDMGWSDPGCYGSEIPTPALDTLARQGMLATRLYTASRCSPSRASIMTGCEPHKADIGLLDDDSGRLNPNIPTPAGTSEKSGIPYLSFREMASWKSPGSLSMGPRLRPLPRLAGRCGRLLQTHAGPTLRGKRETAPSGRSAGGLLHDERYHQNGSGLY